MKISFFLGCKYPQCNDQLKDAVFRALSSKQTTRLWTFSAVSRPTAAVNFKATHHFSTRRVKKTWFQDDTNMLLHSSARCPLLAVRAEEDVRRFLFTAPEKTSIDIYIFFKLLSREIYEEKDFAMWIKTGERMRSLRCGHPRMRWAGFSLRLFSSEAELKHSLFGCATLCGPNINCPTH